MKTQVLEALRNLFLRAQKPCENKRVWVREAIFGHNFAPRAQKHYEFKRF